MGQKKKIMHPSGLKPSESTFTVTDLNTVEQLLSSVNGVINGSHNFTITNHRESKCKYKQLFASSLPQFLHVYTISMLGSGVGSEGSRSEA